jgi:ribonuclease I
LEEDADDWLNIDPQDFENMLQASLPASRRDADPAAMDVDNPEPAESAEDRLASEQASKLKELAEKVEGFVEGEGDLEGARFEEYVLSLSW